MMVLRTGAEGRGIHPVEDAWQHPVTPHGEQDARLAVEPTSVTEKIEMTAPAASDGGPDVRAGDDAQDRREAGLLALEVLVGLRSDPGERHEEVDRRNHDQVRR